MTAQLGLFQSVGRCRFFLGTHETGWLRTWTDGPLFVSRRRLARRKSWPRAAGPWAMDSGGFTEITTHGGWTVGAKDYAAEVRVYADAIGSMEWAATQDWMCETAALDKTGKSIAEHQRLSVRSYLDLMTIAPDLPWVPVVQGFTRDDYLRCADLYEAEGVDLAALPTVGVGSVCRRQGTREAVPIIAALHARSRAVPAVPVPAPVHLDAPPPPEAPRHRVGRRQEVRDVRQPAELDPEPVQPNPPGEGVA